MSKKALMMAGMISCYSCRTSIFEDGKMHEYKMVSYMSKAWVDTSAFPAIRIYPDNKFEIISLNRIAYDGEVQREKDSLGFYAKKRLRMPANFLDSAKNTLRVYQLTTIGVEAKWGDFKKVQ